MFSLVPLGCFLPILDFDVSQKVLISYLGHILESIFGDDDDDNNDYKILDD